MEAYVEYRQEKEEKVLHKAQRKLEHENMQPLSEIPPQLSESMQLKNLAVDMSEKIPILAQSVELSEILESNEKHTGIVEPTPNEHFPTSFQNVNFHFTPNFATSTKGFAPKEKFRQNIEAIRTLQNIESEHRIATPQEQQILAKYVGWGI